LADGLEWFALKEAQQHSEAVVIVKTVQCVVKMRGEIFPGGVGGGVSAIMVITSCS
jgi:hypothetical protein